MLSKVGHEFDELEAETILSIDSPRNDVGLVFAAKGGDGQAFEILVSRHWRRLLGVVSRFARIREDAEDIVQQTLQKAFVHLPNFEGKSAFSTWLTRIAINEALMWLRRKRASREIPIEESGMADEPALPIDFPDSDPSPEDRCLQRERKRILSAAMNDLPPGMRTAIELRDLDELSTEETARVMALSVEAVKGRLFHARRRLRKSLEHYLGSTWTSRRHSSRRIANAKHGCEDRLPSNAWGKPGMRGGSLVGVPRSRRAANSRISVSSGSGPFDERETTSLRATTHLAQPSAGMVFRF